MPRLLKSCFPRRIWEGPADGKRLYLTFDDGPIPEVTPWVLDVLQKYNARASFFCIGDNVQKHPEIFQQVIKAGHVIGNHSFHHLKGWGCNTEVYIKDALLAQKEIWKQGAPRNPGQQALYYRPPYGKMSSAQAKGLQAEGFSIVMWDILSRDYLTNLKPDKIFRQIKKYTRPGSIIIFHDSLKAEKNLKAVLPQVLEHYSKEGYLFDHL